MRGTIRKDIKKDGTFTYSYMVYIGTDEYGKKKYKRKRGFEKEKECEIALAAYITKISEGTAITNDKMTVSQYMNYWLETYPKVNCQPSTYKRYTEFTKDIKNYLGTYKLVKLNPLLVQKFYSDLSIERKLSNNTIIKIHRMFHLALKCAQKWQMIYVNPCDLVTPPKATDIVMKYWDPEDIKDYVNELKGEFLYPVIATAVQTGLREGELCGLQWNNIDLINKTMIVSKTLQRIDGVLQLKKPKTKKSSRVVTLYDSTVQLLKTLKTIDKAKKLEKGIELNYVFHWDDTVIIKDKKRENDKLEYRPIDPHYVSEQFSKIILSHKNKDGKQIIPLIRFHDLRHTHATLLRKLKVDAKVISERLGHSDVAFTLKTYTHVNTEMQREEVLKAQDYL